MSAELSTPGPLTRKRLLRPLEAQQQIPTVTVIIPCYNYARFLPDSVGSALNQSGVRVDVIVVDDCSTDDSVEVARRLAAADPRVQVIDQPVNRGPVDTFNTGLSRATGEFLVRLDADDLLTDGSLARSTALARAFPSVGLVYGRPRHFVGKIPRSRADRARRWTVWPGGVWLAGRCSDGYNVITSPEALMRRSVVDRVGGQRPLAHTHDMEMWFRIAGVSDVGYVRGCDQALHRDHAASLSVTQTDPVEELRERRDAFAILFAGVVGERDDAGRLQAAARAAIALDATNQARQTLQRLDRGQLEAAPSAARLRAFALETDPGVIRTRAWHRLERAEQPSGNPTVRRLRGLGEAIGRRLGWRLRRERWFRTGTFDGR